VAFLVGIIPLFAQDRDVVIAEGDRKSFTVVDQVSDPAERRAFIDLFRKKDPAERAKAAETFLDAYPASWLLPEVYEIIAKAKIDAGQYEVAMKYGRQSLRLLPENPLLLVPLANVEVRLGLTAEAEQSANDALEYLDRIGRSSSIPRQQWPQIERELRASCYFVLGRAATVESLRKDHVQERKELAGRAVDCLKRARALNPADTEISYLLGLAYSSAGNPAGAAASFAAVARAGGPLQGKAIEHLRGIYAVSQARQIGFEEFVLHQEGEQRIDPAPAPLDPLTSPGPLPDYAGSQACRACHAGIYEAWSQTGMARMFRPYRPENILGDFQNENEYYKAAQGANPAFDKSTRDQRETLFARMTIIQGRHYFNIQQSDGLMHRYPVDYTIGSKWEQAYATRLANGQIHVFPIQYNAIQKRWVNFWKIIDPPTSLRADLNHWESLDAWTSYQANCAACHTSQLQNVRGRGFEPANLEFREPGINCEMCHGPSARHVAAMQRGEFYEKKPLDPPVDFSKISSRESVAICAQCHMQSALREPGPKGELNFSREAGIFYVHFKSRPYAEFSFNARYKDGRFKETSFIVESLMRTACFKKGGATCVHCHNPHPADAAQNRNSLKFFGQPDQMCLQCHGGFAGKIEAHTHHPAESEASRCVSCHMPRIANALLFKARSHEFDSIPDSEMTARFGQADSPNACLLCHQDKDPQWLRPRLLSWRLPR
jgi:predicted CXXCH cytochrome family protein